MFSRIIVILFATLITCTCAISPSPTPTYSHSSLGNFNTTASTADPTNCCFVIQETVNAEWWPVTNVSYVTKEVKLTSITTLITPLHNGTVTNVATNVYPTNASFPVTKTLGNPLWNYPNDAFSLEETDTELNGTAVITGGVTVQSPQAFYVYTTVKVITAKPVTNTDGQVMCGTVSSWDAPNWYDVQATFSNINSNAEAHFGGSTIGGATVEPTLTATHTYSTVLDSSTLRYIATETAVGTWFTNLEGHTIQPTIASSGEVIKLTTPFIYQPTRGANPATEDPRACFQGAGSENFGYIPQTLVDFLALDPYYVSLYPYLTSCLPAGPSILPVMGPCRNPEEVIIQSAVGGDLTESSTSTVLPSGGGPGLLPGSPTGKAVDLAENTPTTASETVPPTSINPVVGGDTATANSVGSTTTVNGTPLLVIQPTSIPVANAPSGLTGSTTLVSGTPFLVIPTPTTIAALPGSITIISGSAFDFFTGLETVPVNPNIPLEGSTTVVSGTTMVVVPSPTIVPILPGSLTVKSGSLYDVFTGPTTVPVNGELSLSGQTTVISGVTEVILSGATTVPVNKQNGPAYVQASGASRGKNSLFGFLFNLVQGFVLRFR